MSLPLIVKRSTRSVSTELPFTASARSSNEQCVAGARKPSSILRIASGPCTGSIGMLW
jgi:hypothetical protein